MSATGCVCRTDPAAGPAHEEHAKWCAASRPTAERIAEIRQGIGDELTRDELYWLSGAAGRHELHVTGARGGHWPLTDDLPGAVLLLAQYLAAAVAVIARSQPYATTRPTWEKDSATPAPTSTPQPEACANCRQPFDPTDTRFDGRARFHLTPFCRSCVDRCHESTDFAHECTVCRRAGAEGGDAR